jgi:hypothetical protein
MADILKLVGIGLGTNPDTKSIYRITLAHLFVFLITWVVNYFVLEDEWSLYGDQPILWVLQLLVLLEALHVSGFDDKNFQGTRKLLVSLFLASANWILAFVYVIEETVDCNKIESADLANMQRCYDMVSSSISATQGLVCQVDSDMGSRATGVCPQVRFGNGGGTVWIIWQFLLVIFFIATDLALFYYTMQFQKNNETENLEGRGNTIINTFPEPTEGVMGPSRVMGKIPGSTRKTITTNQQAVTTRVPSSFKFQF